MLPNGNYRLDFSETFHKLENLWSGERNFTMLNEIRHQILELTFKSELEQELKNTNQMKYVPQIDNWLFVNFTQFYFDIDINFTNPLNVSQAIVKDTIKAKVLHPWPSYRLPFASVKSGYTIKQNYTTEEFIVPS